MDLQQQPGLIIERFAVVAQVGLVGGADLAQGDAAGLHDIRNAKGAADFDHLAARDDRLLAPGQSGQGEQHRAGVVVDHRGGLGAGQAAEHLLDVAVAVPAAAGVEIDFKVRIGAGHRVHRCQRFFTQRRAAEVGVQQSAGGVDDVAQRRPRR